MSDVEQSVRCLWRELRILSSYGMCRLSQHRRPQKGENDDDAFKDRLDSADEENARVSHDRTETLNERWNHGIMTSHICKDIKRQPSEVGNENEGNVITKTKIRNNTISLHAKKDCISDLLSHTPAPEIS